jgi:single-strand DNA-binding protein
MNPMLNALASGQLVRDPKSGTSASGTRWSNTTIRCNVGQSKEGDAEAAFITIVCFGDVADKLSRLAKGDAVSVQGNLKPTEHQKDGETRHGLEIIANAILSAYDLRKKRGIGDSPPKQERTPQRDYGAYEFDDRPGF